LTPGEEETAMAAIPMRQRAMKALFLESHKRTVNLE
jgi:hypothetical protein